MGGQDGDVGPALPVGAPRQRLSHHLTRPQVLEREALREDKEAKLYSYEQMLSVKQLKLLSICEVIKAFGICILRI